MIRFRFGEELALAIAISLVALAGGLYFHSPIARAGNLTFVSDVLSDSGPGTVATHTIQYTNSTSTGAGLTIEITFDPANSQFSGAGSVTTSSVQFSGATLVDACSAGSDRVTLSTSSNAVTFTVCAGNTVASGTKTIAINGITNPTSTGSYVVRIGGTQLNSGDAMVAIVNKVILTALVDTTFTFSITGVATGTTINGVTTTYASTPTALAFGTLPLNTPVTLGQQLAVVTNAPHGFAVGVVEDQNPLSATGADIDLFPNGLAAVTPLAWSAPSSTAADENTAGHFGVTSDDADFSSGAFSGSKFAGNMNGTGTVVFAATSSADGLTQNIGLVSVAYRIQIGILQEAANDYTNTLTYIATPVF